MSRTVEIDLAGALVRFRCDLDALGAYAEAHLAPVRRSGDRDFRPVIDADLHWHEGAPPPAAAYPEFAGTERLDRDLYAGPGRLLWLRIDELRDLHLRFRWDGEVLTVRGDYYHRLSTVAAGDRLRRLLYRGRLEELRRKRFTRLLYFLVYYPAFWWLEHVCDLHPIHAGAVDTPAGGIVLAGPSGVGKSTLTTALGAAAGCRLLSDTFVVQRGTEVRAVPEPLLLDRWSVEWLGDAATGLEPLAHAYALGRGGYVLPRGGFAASTNAGVVVLPRRGPEHFLRRIDGAEALARIQAYDDIVNDLRRYRPLAAVLELLDPTGLGAARQRALADLTTSAACFEMGLTPTLPREQAVRTLLATFDDREPRRIAPGG